MRTPLTEHSCLAIIGPTGLDRSVQPIWKEAAAMEWWAWALIALGVLALGYLKVKVLGNMMRKKKKGPPMKDED